MRILLLGAVLCLVHTAAYASHTNQNTAADETAIRATANKVVSLWNTHDAKGLSELFAPDATLINPTGRVANGRPEIEKLLTDEHATIFKKSSASMGDTTIQWLNPQVVIADHDMTITGAVGHDGKTTAPTTYHVATVQTKKNNQWWISACRPYTFQQMNARHEASVPTTN